MVSHLLACLLVLVLIGPARAATITRLVGVGDYTPFDRPFSSFSDPVLDDGGRAAFTGASTALFRRTGAGIVELSVAGGVVQGGGTIAAIGTPAVGPTGCVATRLTLVGGAELILRDCEATDDVLVRSGDPAPGGRTIRGLGPVVAHGEGGHVALTATLDDHSVVLLRWAPGGLVLIASSGTPSPNSGTFAGFRPVGVSLDGAVAFRATVTGGPDGIFFWDGTDIAALALVNSASPAGGRFTVIGGATMNSSGVVAFRAGSSTGGAGVFRVEAAAPGFPLAAVATEGAPTPLGPGSTLRAFPSSLVPSVNAAGAVAFRATVLGAVYNAGVFVAEPNGTTRKVVAAAESTGAGQLVRLRDPVLADDGSVLVGASLPGAGSGLFVGRDNAVSALARLGEATSAGGGYRFTVGDTRSRAEDAAFLGLREGIFRVGADGLHSVAILGLPTPLAGSFAGFDPPAAGEGGRIVFRADILNGRAGEALFLYDDQRGLTTLAQSGAKAPRGGRFVNFSTGALEAVVRPDVRQTVVAFQALLSGSSAGSGLFGFTRHGRSALARAGGKVSGGGRFGSFGAPALLSAREVTFVATQSATPSPAVYWRKGSKLRQLAGGGLATRTRIAGRFDQFDPPDAGAAGVLFRATLRDPVGEGVFVANRTAVGALAGSGDASPDGGVFRAFGVPTLAGQTAAFTATTSDPVVRGGLYRIAFDAIPAATDPPLPVERLLGLDAPSPDGGRFVTIGSPNGNRAGAIAVAAELIDATVPSGLYLVIP